MNWINQRFWGILQVAIISLVLFVVIDFFVGSHLFKLYGPIEERYRVIDETFHHSLLPNYDGLGVWGGRQYRICTNTLGFKDTCDKSRQTINHADIAFIGDSFTEGIGLSFEDTFVGQISLARPDLKIINMGVSSYSPSIFLAKVKWYVNQGLKFKELIAYIDISDIQDEGVLYIYEDGVVRDKYTTDLIYSAKIKLKKNFRLTYFMLKIIRSMILKRSNLSLDIINYSTRGEWTYVRYPNGYGEEGVDVAINKTINIMNELYMFLNERGIKLSIGIYPWPNQLRHDVANSKQVIIWKDFCKNRCVNFYNSFDTFFSLKEKIKGDAFYETYFFQNDVHFNNRNSTSVIAKDFLKSYN